LWEKKDKVYQVSKGGKMRQLAIRKGQNEAQICIRAVVTAV